MPPLPIVHALCTFCNCYTFPTYCIIRTGGVLCTKILVHMGDALGMPTLRLSRRARIAKQTGIDPAEVIHQMVYREGCTLDVAGARFDVNRWTARRWLDAWEREQASTEKVAV